MFRKIIADPSPPPGAKPREGDLYRVVTVYGKTFELRYGYYADIDRKTEPDVIYPDFRAEPVYTKEGEPFVTMMQDACKHFKGKLARTDDTTCSECRYLRRSEEWFGICTCPRNRKQSSIKL